MIAMFFPKDNPGYYSMSEEAKKLIILWSTNEWYESSTMEAMMETFVEDGLSKDAHQEL